MYDKPKYAPSTNFYLRRIAWLTFGTLVVNLALMGMVIGIMAGGLRTMGQMDNMEKGMVEMMQGKEAATQALQGLQGKFPANQMEVTTRQVLKIIEDVRMLTARAQEMTQHIEPNVVSKSVQNVNKLMDSISPSEVDQFKAHLLAIGSQLQKITTEINPQNVKQIVTNVAKINIPQINSVIDHLAKLHQIEIKI